MGACYSVVHDNLHVHIIIVGNVMLLDGKCTCYCTINVHVIVQ